MHAPKNHRTTLQNTTTVRTTIQNQTGLRGLSILFCALFALAGLLALVTSHAATKTASVEPETGTTSTYAAVVADSSAAGGKGVELGAAPASFLTRHGAHLWYHGAPYHFVGVNAFGLATCEGKVNDYYSDSDLNDFFASLPAHSVTRIWATSQAPLSTLDRVIASATAHNQMLILSLANSSSGCNANYPINSLAWYQSGYKADYLSWVRTIVPRYAASPAVAMWELMNEPGWSCSGTTHDCGASRDEMKSFFDTSAAVVKSLDPYHLVETGAIGGTYIASMRSQADVAYTQSGPDIDVTSMHEYEYQANGNMGVGSAYATDKAAADSIQKPLIIGEVGAPFSFPTTQTCRDPTVTGEVLMKNKFDAYLGQGAAGVLVWDWMKQMPAGLLNGCGSNQHYFFGDDNPILTMIRTYNLP